MIVGTLGKALGSYGAFVACDQQMARYLVNAARTFIFSTALPPPAVAGALAALDLLQERPRLVDKLAANAAALRDRAACRRGSTSARRAPRSCRWSSGEAQLAMRICELALTRGVFAQAIRPPTVPDMTSRLRLAVMASHREEELRAAARTLGAVARSVGLQPARMTASAPAREVEECAPAATGHRRVGVGAVGFAADRRRHRGAVRACSTSRRPSRSAAPPRAGVVMDRAGRDRRPDLRGCFVTGTDTGVGKTVVAAAIVAWLRAAAASPCARSSR